MKPCMQHKNRICLNNSLLLATIKAPELLAKQTIKPETNYIKTCIREENSN